MADKVSLIFLGDTGTGDDNQRRVAKYIEHLAEKHSAAAVVLCGDNFMDKGVSSASDPQWQSKFEDMYALDLPFYAILGNHDYKGNVRSQIDYSKGNRRWRMPSRHYVRTLSGIVDLIAIDTNWPDYTGLGLLSMDKIARQAKLSASPWKLVLGHRPLLTGGKYRKVPWNVRWFLQSFMRQSGANIYISGHDHNLQHLYDAQSGIHQIVSGGGGSPLQPVESIPNISCFSAMCHGAVVGEFTREQAKFYFYSVDEGDSLHYFGLGE